MIAAESQAWRGLRRLQRLLHCAMLRVYCDEYRFMAATRIIKKYPNRRLYDTEISSYITIEDVRQLFLVGNDLQQDRSREVVAALGVADFEVFTRPGSAGARPRW
jgi:PHB/PHA accumulation regulator DNA-binding domain